MSTWNDVTTSLFNLIQDGRPVNERITNHVINNIAGNLQYLYDRIGRLEENVSAVVVYDSPISDADDRVFIGTPVFWNTAGSIPGWSPAYIKLKDLSSDTPTSVSHWEYDAPALASGVVISRTSSTVDVVLSGSTTLPVSDGAVGVGDFKRELTQLFSTGDTSGIPSSFNNGGLDIEHLKNGVYYLSTSVGQLSPVNNYTRVIAVVTPESRTTDSGQEYYLRLIVCPEGFGGERFHVHEKYELTAGLGTSTPVIATALPYTWYPIVDGDGQPKYLNIAVGQVNPDSNVYPYSELQPANDAESLADHALKFYGTVVEDTLYQAGWLSASDPYFDGVDVPEDAIWGYALKHDTRFAPGADDENWNAPSSFKQMLLTRNGVPVPSNFYVINESGIWWTKVGVEHAPINDIFEADKGGFELWAIAEFNEMEGRVVNSVESNGLVVDTTDGVVSIEPRSSYIDTVLTPVLPFNPIDDVRRASVADARAGTDLKRIMTPSTVLDSIKKFAALSLTDDARSCQKHIGTWNTLDTSGLWLVRDVVHKPVELDVDSTDWVLALVGRSSVAGSGEAGTEHVFQFCFDPRSRHEAYLRIGADQSFDPLYIENQAEDGKYYWGDWMQITPRRDPLYLPGSNPITTTNLDFGRHSRREIISLDGRSDIVLLPSLKNFPNPAYLEAQSYHFVNRTTPGVQKSMLVVKLSDPVNGSGHTHFVNLAQNSEEANHFMGRVLYSTGALNSIPLYINYQVVNNTVQVLGDSLAAQSYGDNRLVLECLDTTWSVMGGTGVWFSMDTATFTTWELGGYTMKDLISLYRGGSAVVHKLTTRPIISMSAFADYSVTSEAIV